MKGQVKREELVIYPAASDFGDELYAEGKYRKENAEYYPQYNHKEVRGRIISKGNF